MNIFVLDLDPRKAAQAHCNCHVVKMILESNQILSTVWHNIGQEAPEGAYKPTHSKHPCTLWAGASRANYEWLCYLCSELCEEYSFRYGRMHKSEAVLDILCSYPDLPDVGLTPFALAMPDEYKQACPVESYRAYYHFKAATIKRFTYKTEWPEWLQTNKKGT